jgi:dipeptidyl aminopeptidase/acylaminoacyl peptidase
VPAGTATDVDIDRVPSFLNAELADLALLDVRTGAVRRLARRVRVTGYRFSPDGRRVAFSARQPDAGRGMLVYDRYDLFVVDVAGGAPRLVAPRVVQEYGLGFSFSPNGRRLAYAASDAVMVQELETGVPPQRLAREGVSLAHEYRPPLWIDDRTLVVAARDTVWRASLASGRVSPAAAPTAGWRLIELAAHADAARLVGRAVHVVVSDPATKRMGLQRLDLATGLAEPLHADDVAITGLPFRVDAASDGGTVVYVAERADHPAELWLAGGTHGRPRRLTELNPQVTRFALGHARLVEWDGPGGQRLRGALLLPAGYEPGRRYPLVVEVYGGERLSATLNRFGLRSGIDNRQLLATRGYAVLLPDTPLRVGQPLADLAATTMGGVDAVIAMGVADSTRMALMGHSYGGYSTLAILVQTTRFRAAVSSGGFGNLVTHYGAMREDGSAVGVGWSEREQGRMGGSPWEHRERYIANSPYFFLDRIRTPILLLHGGADRTVAPREAEETFVALRRLGQEATLVRYEGEGHHPGTWRTTNAEDYCARVFAWLARHLGEAPAAADAGG